MAGHVITIKVADSEYIKQLTADFVELIEAVVSKDVERSLDIAEELAGKYGEKKVIDDPVVLLGSVASKTFDLSLDVEVTEAQRASVMDAIDYLCSLCGHAEVEGCEYTCVCGGLPSLLSVSDDGYISCEKWKKKAPHLDKKVK